MSGTVLDQICARTLETVAARSAAVPEANLRAGLSQAPPVRDFAAALRTKADAGQLALIAEMKRASPSAGTIRSHFDPATIAESYRDAGAACLSVLTDEPYFQGQDADLLAARAASGLPVLRKDFMLTPYQIIESRVLGADCVLLIMACLTDAQAQALSELAGELGMCRLLEVHDAAELDRALTIKGELIGINNRDLKTLVTDTATTERLLPRCPPDRMVISESGLKTHADLARLNAVGVGGYLVGESLLKQPELLVATRRLLGLDQPEAMA